MDVRVKISHSTLNGLFDSLLVDPVLRTLRGIQLQFAADWKQLMTSFPADFLARFSENRVKHGDPRLNLYRYIPPEAV